MPKLFTPMAFMIFWILPVGWVGLMRSNYPLYPTWIAPLFRVSGVFENAPSHWRVYFIEFEDSSGWHCLDERLIFASTPLGNRTRFQPLMAEIVTDQPEGASKLLVWISNRMPPVAPSISIKVIRIIRMDVPPETFLKAISLSDVYKISLSAHLPRSTVASLNLGLPAHENP